MTQNGAVQLRTACNRDCPDACSIVATIENGKVVRLQGDQQHPITKGFLCYRTSRFLSRQYDPNRITTPLIRCNGELSPASWDEALSLIAESMTRIKRESTGAAILHYRCGGSMGIMKSVTDFFFEQFGPVTIKSGDICTGAGDAAQMEDFGEEDSHDLFDLQYSKNIVIWGKNAYVSQVHLLPVLREARRRGARLILIDPVHHRTAGLCEQYLQPRPGGDIALALGTARYLLDNSLHDTSAPTYCDHFDQFSALACSRSIDEWASLADVSQSQLKTFAQSYAEGPSAILVGWGMQRRANGSAAIRVLDALGAVSGNLGVIGGGVSFYFKRRAAFDLSFVRGEEAAPRTIPEPLLGPGILEARDPPIRMVWVTCANPVAMLPDSKSVEEALKTRELTVVVDSFLTDTARCADVVLPTTTMLEDDDLLGAYGHHYLMEVRPVIAPPPEVKTDYEIVQELISRVQLNETAAKDLFSQDVETWKRSLLKQVSDRGASLDDLRRGAVRNPLSPQVLFADRKFSTPSGKVNLITVVEPQPPQTTEDRPLLLAALSTEKAQGSQWANGAKEGPITAVVHPDAAPGFSDGDLAIVQSEIGQITVRLQFDDRQRRDVLLTPKGGSYYKGRCANSLVRAQQTDAGGCAVYYDTPVCLAPFHND